MKVKLSTVFTLLILFSVLLMGIGYASVNNIVLNITGEAKAEKPEGVYISGVTLDTTNSRFYSKNNTHINDFYQTMMNSTIKLSKKSNDPQVVFDVTVHNDTNNPVYYLGDFYGKEFYDNNKVLHRIEGINIGDVLNPNQRVSFKIIFYYDPNLPNRTTGQVLNSCINFKFKQRFSVAYSNIVKDGLPQFAYDGMPFEADISGVKQVGKLKIKMNDKTLVADRDYTYLNNIIKVNNVDGPLNVINLNTNSKLKITYVNIEANGNPTEIGYQSSFEVHVDPSIIRNIEVREGNRLLTEGEGYTIIDGVIKISRPEDDIEIKYAGPEDNYFISYVDINNIDKPSSVIKNGKLVVDFTNDNIISLDVKINNNLLNSNQFKYENGILEIYKVTGNVEIINTSSSISNEVNITYKNIIKDNLPIKAIRGKNLIVDLTGVDIYKLEITINDSFLLENEYSFKNNILEIYKVTGDVTITNLDVPKPTQYSVQYVNINSSGKPVVAEENKKFVVDLSGENIDKISVMMNGVILKRKNFKFKNKVLEIPKVNGDIVVSNIISVGDVKINYVNITSLNKPNKTQSGKPFVIDLSLDNIEKIEVYIDDIIAVENKDYTFVNDILTVNNPKNTLSIKMVVAKFPKVHDIEFLYQDISSVSKPNDGIYGYQFSLVNLTNRESLGWRVYIKVSADFKLDSSRSSLDNYSATLKDGVLTLENLSWNGKLPPGGSGPVQNLQLVFTTKDTSMFPLVYASEVLDYDPNSKN